MSDKPECVSNNMISNTIGLPLLASRLAINAVTIKNNPNIKTKKECNEFLIKDLTIYSKELKKENCPAYMLIDKYIKNLKQL